MSETQSEEPSDELYFVRRRGKTDGPWSDIKLKSEVKLRKLSRFHEVSQDKIKWSRAETLSWLFPKVEPKAKINKAPTPQTLTQADVVAPSESPSETKSAARDTTDSFEWFLGIDGIEVGPLSAAEVENKIATGEAGKMDLAWREGFVDWLPLAHLSEFTSVLSDFQSEVRSAATKISRSNDLSPSMLEEFGPNMSSLATASLITGVASFPFLTVASFLLGLISMKYIVVGLWLSMPLGVVAATLGLLALQNLLRPDSRQTGKGRAAIGLITGAAAVLGFGSLQLYYLIYPLVTPW